MPQTELISTRRHPVALYIIAAVSVVLAIVARVAYEQISWANTDLVHWKTISDGEKEAKKLHKPVLYYFTAEWCGPCKNLKAECFSNAKIADQINATYVPIRIIDRKLEDGENSAEVKGIQEKYDIDSFPELVAVPWENIDATREDTYTPVTFAQNILRNSFSYYLPGHRGYRGKDHFEEYLRVMQIWNKMLPARGNVNWKPVDSLWQAPGAKPKLIVVLTDRQSDSNYVRTNFISVDDVSKYLNQYFDSYLVEYSPVGVSKTQSQAEELRAKYGLKKLPAFIVLEKEDKEPSVLTGHSGNVSTLDFLERATHGQAKAPELKRDNYY